MTYDALAEEGTWRPWQIPKRLVLVPLVLLGLLCTWQTWQTWRPVRRQIDDWEQIPGIEAVIETAEGWPAERRELNDLFYGNRQKEIPWMRAECSIDVVQATSYLGQAVVFLYKAIKYEGLQCPDRSPSGCAVSVSGFIASMFWLASYLSLAGSACASAMNSNGLCGADWMALTADFAEVANAGAGIHQDCDLDKDWLALFNVTGEQGVDRVEATTIQKITALHEANRNRDFDVAQCVFDVTNSASFVVRSILQLRSASRACANPRNCAIDIMEVVSSFAWISRFLSMAASDCATGLHLKALCAADISNLVAALSNGPAAGVATTSDCASIKEPLDEIMHEPT